MTRGVQEGLFDGQYDEGQFEEGENYQEEDSADFTDSPMSTEEVCSDNLSSCPPTTFFFCIVDLSPFYFEN